MKKLLYINLDFLKYHNKATSQVKAFKQLRIDTDVATIENINGKSLFKIYTYKNNVFKVTFEKEISDSYEVQQGKNSIPILMKRLFKTIKINNHFKKELIKYYDTKNYDYCYVRRIGFFVIFLKKMFKHISRTSSIIYEIPTYPLDKYDSFLVNLAQKIEMICFNMFIKKYLTLIPVILQNDVKIDKKMIPISNGIDYDKFANVEITKPQFNKEFKMLVVAHVLPWHGYDRLIESMKNYNGKYKLTLDIFGDFNTELKKLQNLVNKYKLDDQVNFKGLHPLDDILLDIPKYHIAIGSLAYHRRNGKYDTSIKNKEYAAMGLPMICSARDLSFNDDFSYIFYVPSNDSAFEFDDIIEWYRKQIYKTNYKKKLINYAKNHLKYQEIYKNVFDRLGEINDSEK